jgi:hypothetical protein
MRRAVAWSPDRSTPVHALACFPKAIVATLPTTQIALAVRYTRFTEWGGARGVSRRPWFPATNPTTMSAGIAGCHSFDIGDAVGDSSDPISYLRIPMMVKMDTAGKKRVWSKAGNRVLTGHVRRSRSGSPKGRRVRPTQVTVGDNPTAPIALLPPEGPSSVAIDLSPGH